MYYTNPGIYLCGRYTTLIHSSVLYLHTCELTSRANSVLSGQLDLPSLPPFLLRVYHHRPLSFLFAILRSDLRSALRCAPHPSPLPSSPGTPSFYPYSYTAQHRTQPLLPPDPAEGSIGCIGEVHRDTRDRAAVLHACTCCCSDVCACSFADHRRCLRLSTARHIIQRIIHSLYIKARERSIVPIDCQRAPSRRNYPKSPTSSPPLASFFFSSRFRGR